MKKKKPWLEFSKLQQDYLVIKDSLTAAKNLLEAKKREIEQAKAPLRWVLAGRLWMEEASGTFVAGWPSH